MESQGFISLFWGAISPKHKLWKGRKGAVFPQDALGHCRLVPDQNHPAFHLPCVKDLLRRNMGSESPESTLYPSGGSWLPVTVNQQWSHPTRCHQPQPFLSQPRSRVCKHTSPPAHPPTRLTSHISLGSLTAPLTEIRSHLSSICEPIPTLQGLVHTAFPQSFHIPGGSSSS